MTVVQVALAGLLAVFVYMAVLWLLSLWKRDSSLADIFWGPGFVLLAAVYALAAEGYPARQLLVLLLVSVWGLRLALRIFRRNRGHGEDPRYQKWRAAAGANYWWVSFFQVFALQGLLMFVISAPLLAAQFSPQPARLGLFDALGAALWAVGFFFEAVGDWQLDRFKANPANRGQVLNSGLWATTRHPNYFGDAMLWWGYFFIALGTPGGLWTVFAPALMTWLLVRVSGVALVEQDIAERRPGYREYAQSTSAFVPWFKKK
jgi:steroid 5-alpha reductase family enzyme